MNKFFKSSRFIWRKNFSAFSICVREQYSAKIQQLLDDPEVFLAKTSGPFFKNDPGDTTTIALLTIGDKKLVVKRYNIKSFRHFLKKCWRNSCAMRSFVNIYKLQKIAIATLVPVAIVEKRFGPLRRQAYLITEYLDGTRGCDYFAADMPYTAQWPKVIKNIVDIIKKLQNAKLYHHDFQYGNMQILSDGRVTLLDLDHMQQYHSDWLFQHAWHKDIQHFLNFIKSNTVAYNLLQKQLADETHT